MDVREAGWGGAGLINVAQERVQWLVVVNMVMNIRAS
jgi:hypothetical protein